ncbi:MAG TPA: Uma2 family endonuclease [Gemmatimonadales bacterium]|nr:Uma2 family endonuclease [Gemmatimonadales bacterium]
MSEPARPLTFLDDEQTWPVQGHWTYEDYLRLPDDGRRYEVIRGVLYVSPSPGYDHQYVLIQLALTMGQFVVANGLGIVLGAPFDILLSRVATPVEPDFLFIRKGREPRSGDRNYSGVPDLIVEVLSPRSRRYDQRTKFEAYEEAEVPEYWLVDPMARAAVIYVLGEKGRYVEFSRGGEGETVQSRVLEGFSLRVADLFPPLT